MLGFEIEERKGHRCNLVGQDRLSLKSVGKICQYGKVF